MLQRGEEPVHANDRNAVLCALVRRGITSRPRRAERSRIRAPSTETNRSVIGICFSTGAPERPRYTNSYERRTGRNKMLPTRPSGRWTISAKTGSGRGPLLLVQEVAHRGIEVGVAVTEPAEELSARAAHDTLHQQLKLPGIDCAHTMPPETAQKDTVDGTRVRRQRSFEGQWNRRRVR